MLVAGGESVVFATGFVGIHEDSSENNTENLGCAPIYE